MGVLQVHVDSPQTLLIKIRHDDKLDKDFVKLKLRRDPTSENLDLYELKTDFFDNGKPEAFLLFVHNFNITLEAPVMLEPNAKDQYLCRLVCGEYLRQFKSLYYDM